MAQMFVKLEWDGDNLGPMWMNEDNLKALLYGKTQVKEEHLKAVVIGHSESKSVFGVDIAEPIDEKPMSLEDVGKMVQRRLNQ